MSSNNNNNNAAAPAHLTVLDRRIIPLLENADETASRQSNNNNNKQEHRQQNDTTNDGTKQAITTTTTISPRMERIHRLHGTSLLYDAALLLEMGASTYATACTLFHRFFAQVSLTDHDVWSVAMASLLLATKLEEEQGKVPYTLSQMALVFCHLYRKRLLWILPTETTTRTTTTTTISENNHHHPINDNNHDGNDNHDTNNEEQQNSVSWLFQLLKQCNRSDSISSSSYESAATVAALSPFAETWTTIQKETRLAHLPLPHKLGPVHQEWISQLSKMEQVVLRQLGFTLYWIPDSHPHKYILYFCRVLELDQAQVCVCVFVVCVCL
jgi:Cyclin, N-terminal domain